MTTPNINGCCELCRANHQWLDEKGIAQSENRCCRIDCPCHTNKDPMVEKIKKQFFEATWRTKLDRWTSPAGKGHTLAHIEIAFDEALLRFKEEVEGEMNGLAIKGYEKGVRRERERILATAKERWGLTTLWPEIRDTLSK